ncbi:MAG TPA: hypothetical protein PLH57_09280, partial [Oligoflexia bacterium]|nr:hypothetical protein [Oligoflexia bacterium]
MFLLFLIAIWAPATAFSGDFQENVLFCGTAAGSYTIGDERLPLFKATQDQNGDQYVKPDERSSSKERTYRIESFSYLEDGVVRIHRKNKSDLERSASAGLMAEFDLRSVMNQKIRGTEICIFGDLISNAYTNQYYIRPRRFVVYTNALSFLVPSDLDGVYFGKAKHKSDKIELETRVSSLDFQSITESLISTSGAPCAFPSADENDSVTVSRISAKELSVKIL